MLNREVCFQCKKRKTIFDPDAFDKNWEKGQVGCPYGSPKTPKIYNPTWTTYGYLPITYDPPKKCQFQLEHLVN